MTKRAKTVWITVGVVATVFLLLAMGAIGLYGEMIVAANSITKREENLYSMEFVGDYGFDAFLKQGGASSDEEVAAYLTNFLSRGFYRQEVETEEFGCSAVCTGGENALFGRNYDGAKCNAMIVHTKPKNGYESVSTTCLDFLGFEEGYTPDDGMMERIMAIASIYVPLDGMNETGLMVADLLAGDREATHQDGGKVNLTTTTAIRLLLDRADSVEKAVELLSGYDMHSSIDFAHHLFIADRSGKSVVVEYVGGKMIVTETNVVTNYYLAAEKYGVGSEQSHLRFDQLSACSVGSLDEMREALKSVAQFNYPQNADSYEKTMWSVAYDPNALVARFYFAENYEECYTLQLKTKEWLGEKR